MGEERDKSPIEHPPSPQPCCFQEARKAQLENHEPEEEEEEEMETEEKEAGGSGKAGQANPWEPWEAGKLGLTSRCSLTDDEREKDSSSEKEGSEDERSGSESEREEGDRDEASDKSGSGEEESSEDEARAARDKEEIDPELPMAPSTSHSFNKSLVSNHSSRAPCTENMMAKRQTDSCPRGLLASTSRATN